MSSQRKHERPYQGMQLSAAPEAKGEREGLGCGGAGPPSCGHRHGLVVIT